jgi:large-conductance mechanosensitive channel
MYINNSLKYINNKSNILIQNLINFIIIYLVDFGKFIFEKNIIQLTIGIVLSIQLTDIIKNINLNIVIPIINSVIKIFNIRIKDMTYNILGINFYLGDIIQILLQFIVSLFIFYFIWKLFKSNDITYFTNLLEKLKIKNN